MLGIKLSNLGSTKEIILLLTTVLGVVAMKLSQDIQGLTSLRKALFKKKYGAEIFDTISRTFLEKPHDNTPFIAVFNGLYRPVNHFDFRGKLQLVCFGSGIFLGIAIFAWVYGMLLVNIWTDPNIHEIWAKAICILAGILGLAQLYAGILTEYVKNQYIEKKIWDDFPLYEKDSKELSEQARALAKEIVLERSDK